MTETYAHEAWCPRCRITHPPERKQCLHCGGPVLAHRPPDGIAPPPRTGPFGMPAPPEAEEEEAASRVARASRPLRFGFAAIWIVLGIVTAVMRACAERG